MADEILVGKAEALAAALLRLRLSLSNWNRSQPPALVHLQPG
jgi:hypothetical protein